MLYMAYILSKYDMTHVCCIYEYHTYYVYCAYTTLYVMYKLGDDLVEITTATWV